MKLLNKNVCLTSRASILTIGSLLLSTLVIAGVYRTTPEKPIEAKTETPWEPTIEDIAFQDSMYPDGSYDSIRYVVGGKIDRRRNKNE